MSGLSKEERIALLDEKYIIEHPAFLEGYKRLEKILSLSPKFGIDGMFITGPSGIGKTMLVRSFLEAHPPFENEDDSTTINPVVYVRSPASLTVRRFYARFLEIYNATFRPTASITSLESETFRHLRTMKTKMVIIDDIQHADLTKANKTRSELMNLLKDITNSLDIPVICCGLETSSILLADDTQLDRRFPEPFKMDRWKYSVELRDLLMDLEETLPLRMPSNLGEDRMVKKIAQYSHGITGFIVKLLKHGTIYAIQHGQEHITLDILDQIQSTIPKQRESPFLIGADDQIILNSRN